MPPFPFKKKRRNERQKPTFKDIMTAILATIAAIFLLLLAGLSLAGSAVILIVSTPLFFIFSPVLVPAGIATSLLAVTLAAGGGSSAEAVEIITKLVRKLIEIVKKVERGRMSGGGGGGGGGGGAASPATPAASAAAPATKPADKKPADKKPKEKKPAAKPSG